MFREACFQCSECYWVRDLKWLKASESRLRYDVSSRVSSRVSSVSGRATVRWRSQSASRNSTTWVPEYLHQPAGGSTRLAFSVSGRGCDEFSKAYTRGLFWIVLDRSGSFWIVLDRSGSFWIVLDRSGSFWIVLDRSGSFWIVLDRSGSCWIVLDRSGLSSHLCSSWHFLCMVVEWLWELTDAYQRGFGGVLGERRPSSSTRDIVSVGQTRQVVALSAHRHASPVSGRSCMTSAGAWHVGWAHPERGGRQRVSGDGRQRVSARSVALRRTPTRSPRAVAVRPPRMGILLRRRPSQPATDGAWTTSEPRTARCPSGPCYASTRFDFGARLHKTKTRFRWCQFSCESVSNPTCYTVGFKMGTSVSVWLVAGHKIVRIHAKAVYHCA